MDAPMARDQLRSFVDRLTATDLGTADRREIFREAEDVGFDRDALRLVVHFAKMDTADAKEAWATLTLYMTNSVLF